MAVVVMPSCFPAQVHPQLREVMQMLTIQAADKTCYTEVIHVRAA
jgi:hypothetical protein